MIVAAVTAMVRVGVMAALQLPLDSVNIGDSPPSGNCGRLQEGSVPRDGNFPVLAPVVLILLSPSPSCSSSSQLFRELHLPFAMPARPFPCDIFMRRGYSLGLSSPSVLLGVAPPASPRPPSLACLFLLLKESSLLP